MFTTTSNNTFLELEYMTLRKEIETSKSNMFKLVVGGSAIIPAAQSLGTTFQIGMITLALPLIVVVLVLLFLSENHAMMRAGKYILEEIEPKLTGGLDTSGGWETWLNGNKTSDKRTVDRLLIAAFSVLASSYFIASVVLAAKHAQDVFGERGQWLVSGVYLLLGTALAAILYSQAKTATSTESNSN